ncbi:MAG: OsmC family protein [Deltaproteobacteria bacterium]|nr:OsmC family protein [Deltaproteobacteria bacterium]
MGKKVQISMRRVQGALFEAKNERGRTCVVDGPPDVGGTDAGLRPMEMLLAALAGCSAVDVLLIMKKQRQPLDNLDIEVTGERADAVPAVYTSIHVTFTGSGAIELAKLERAVSLSFEKYCSVARMLQPAVKITFAAAVQNRGARG